MPAPSVAWSNHAALTNAAASRVPEAAARGPTGNRKSARGVAPRAAQSREKMRHLPATTSA